MVLLKACSLSILNPEGKIVIATATNSNIQMNEKKTKPGFNRVLLLLTFVGTIGNSVPTGYNLGVINMPQNILEEFCNQTLSERGSPLSRPQMDVLWSIVVSIFLAGAVLGSLCAGYLANRYGRKPTLMANSVVGLVSAALFAFSEIASSVELLIAGRILAGFFGGLGSSVVPMYLMETAPAHMRGGFGVIQQLGLTTGIFLSQILGRRDILGTEEFWPVLLSFYGMGVALGLFVLVFCPRSPSYLYIVRKDEVKAIKELEKLRQMSVNYLEDDMISLRKEQKMTLTNPTWNIWKVLLSPETRLPILLVCAMQSGQQLSGISVVFYYSSSTFLKAGMTENQTEYGSMGAGLMNVIMSLVAVVVVNRSKRRPLILTSMIGIVVCLIGFSISMSLQHLAKWLPYVTISAFLSFVCVYGLGLGPLAHMIGSELFQQGPRAAGMSLGSSANWLANFFVAFAFPYLQEICGDYVFIIFAVFIVLITAFLYKKLPETKGLDPVEVALYLLPKSKATELRDIVLFPVESASKTNCQAVASSI